jgi:competence protein ComEC
VRGGPALAPTIAPTPLGLASAGALLAGVGVVQGLPHLPPIGLAAGLLALGIAGWTRPGAVRLAGAFLAGFGLAVMHGHMAMAVRLPADLSGREWLLEGRVLGLPVVEADAVRFELRVTAGQGAAAGLVGRKLRLGWYAHAPDAVPTLEPGSRWRMKVKLRRPRGLVNPGGFDFERRALEQRIAATGHLVDAGSATLLAPGRGLDAWRGDLSSRILRAVPDPSARFVAALALGDTRALDDHDWQVLRATGLTHLIAISGFHVGLVAGFGVLLGRGLYRLLPALGRRCPLPQGSALAALSLAAAYTALAGFALPTVRTLLMIAAVLLARLLRRPQAPSQALAFALIVVLVIDPLSVLAPGFWLSFLGVAWLMWCLPGPSSSALWRPYLEAQGVAVLGLLPASVWFFSQASLPGPLVNLVGIPWISLGVVPLCLAGLMLAPVWAAGASACWQAAAGLMALLWHLLEWVAAWPAALAWLPEPTPAAIVLAMSGTFWLLLPRGVPGKGLAVLLLLPMLWPRLDRPAHGEVDLLLLDVGQGLALVVQTRNHALLYDAGPAMPRGLDLGESVVVPALRARGLRRLDTLVLSHGDNDHAGGAAAVMAVFPPGRVLAPEGWAGPGMATCEAGQGWAWDGVEFRFLHPPRYFPYQRNQSSCVLRIDAAGASALLPGDIGRHVEARLAASPENQAAADVLLVPHHGSDTSSSLDLLAAVRPRLALLPVGHDNRFRLPKPVVLDRYARYGVVVHDSAGSGAIGLRLGAAGPGPVARLRQDRRRYWRDAAPDRTGYAIGRTEPDR